MATQAVSPVTWNETQDIMGQLGYQLVSHNKAGRFATFRLTGDGLTEGMRNPVTIAHPDWVAADGITPAYERDYLVDLLNQVFGGNGGAKTIMTLLANRRAEC
jgi:hypothetical protein